ncbi:MAG: hypothetical protein ACREBG_28530 [Pyrinomonadaceae bacterium]
MPNCRVLLSTLPGRSLDAIQRRQWPEMTLQPLTVPERKELLAKFLQQFSKKLTASQTERIVSAEQTANPLYLGTLLDELRQFGSYELFEQRLTWYLETTDLRELFERVLTRWEEDFGGETDLVGDSLSLIWASRFGLSEAELLCVLGPDDQPLPRAKWTPIFLATGYNLVIRGGLLNFGHQYLRDAVHEAYFPTETHERQVRLRLASYFDRGAELTDRKLDEEPWLLHEAAAWEQQKKLLAGIPIFVKLRSKERWKWELHRYWVALSSRYDPCDAYCEALIHWESGVSSHNDLPVTLNELATSITNEPNRAPRSR